MTAEELKAQIRRDLSVQKLFNKEITSHISITDKDVADFYNANRDSFNLAEPQIHMAQMLVTPRPDPIVRNLKSDKAQNDEQARKKIQMLEARLKTGRGLRHAGAELLRGSRKARPTAATSASFRSRRWRRPTSSCARW